MLHFLDYGETSDVPVLGHGLVGLALGVWTQPSAYGGTPGTPSHARSVWWTPLIIGVSYGPDICSQLTLVVTGVDVRQITHALPCALVMALVGMRMFAQLTNTSPWRTFVCTLTALILHNLLDLLQATDRMLWWPFSRHLIGSTEPLFLLDPMQETVVFGSVSLVAVIAHALLRRTRRHGMPTDAQRKPYLPLFRWLNVATISTMLLAAMMTQHFRQVREDQLEEARIYSQEKGAYRRALALLDMAEQWPSTARPGRIDYLRGWTYDQLGDRHRAEEGYLRSDQADPMYFWNLADLAAFYAAGPEQRSVRAERVAKYLQRLEDDFANHPNFTEEIGKIKQRLTGID